ncbi:MAG: Asp-tRNA(Asn)/Glu-tRNA(Gln) amidotransferase subunit GatC [Alphaproteobacteria bacterium]|nr:Asp-tRNA(Asn)/Glu-tRNA(Gln) amidotransferase subunit GatC [Alphaproteobacteria bacterium]
MSFTKQQLQKFAHSARIEISDEQLDRMNISSVADWLDKLQAVDTADIVPMLTPADGDAPLREDIVTADNIRDAILSNAPDTIDGYFTVPKVMDE